MKTISNHQHPTLNTQHPRLKLKQIARCEQTAVVFGVFSCQNSTEGKALTVVSIVSNGNFISL